MSFFVGFIHLSFSVLIKNCHFLLTGLSVTLLCRVISILPWGHHLGKIVGKGVGFVPCSCFMLCAGLGDHWPRCLASA